MLHCVSLCVFFCTSFSVFVPDSFFCLLSHLDKMKIMFFFFQIEPVLIKNLL